MERCQRFSVYACCTKSQPEDTALFRDSWVSQHDVGSAYKLKREGVWPASRIPLPQVIPKKSGKVTYAMHRRQ
jgi:hypothetical protein